MVQDLAGLIAPVPVERFVQEYWEKAPLYVSGDPERFRGLFNLESFWRAQGEARFGHGERRVYVKAGHRLANGDHREIPITSGQVPHALAMGMTVQAEWLDSVDEGLHRLLAAVRRELGIAAAMDIGCFISPDGSGYGTHFDATAMWTMQVEGQKRWLYSPAPAVAWPKENFVPTAEDRARGAHGYREDGLVEQVLSPGDVLYLPPGTWHRPTAIGQSVHLSLTVRASSPLQLFSELLGKALGERPEWRHLPSAPGGTREAEAFLEARLAELRAAVAELPAAAVARAFREKVGPAEAPPGAAVAGGALEIPERPRFSYAVDRVEGAVLLLLDGAVVGSLPGPAERFMEKLFAARRFTAAEARAFDPEYEAEEVDALLEQLRRLGALK